MDKKELRVKYKGLRSRLDEEEIDDKSMSVANNLLKLPIWEQAFYHVFLPIQKQKEVNTEFIMHILQGKDKNIVVSKSNFKDNTLEHILLTDATVLKVNSWGIPEPIDGIPIPENKIQVVFVPLLAFDTKGNRVGYGKGFYDIFLAKCDSKTIKIGLSFFDPEKEISEVLPTDISLDYCITPSNIYTFN
ncbi:5-formyltetrahydrofolate cyclo-ligase [Aquimarina sp. 2201CG14-23]|uniref:5-formyltetrahydrofolate cyclo-ligase n=1 Tax=Aquimarina mycalae TaxID=3040073 RepID=UPI002478066E|nr:5-formyltetrahydrofolate cyclo-ligase [Aquimarina sp. 2201CG14-23]MDH7446165.1 5-formyltetrahydrofolate cyclo-ligase [Aquimarina sp. 2201CG14-23]